MSLTEMRSIGAALSRRDGAAKVKGTAPYAFEQRVHEPLYMHAVQSTIARGTITAIEVAAAEALEGVVAVLTHENAPRLASDDNRELYILQDPEVHFRGQLIAAVIATGQETAREAAARVRVTYAQRDHDVVLSPDHPELYKPEKVNPSFPTDTSEGDVEGAMRSAAVAVDETYTTPMEHNNPMEPHATIAIHEGSELILYDSTQGVHTVRTAIAPLFGLHPDQVRVVAPYVGGGFGAKGTPHAHIVLAAMGARTLPGRAVKLALTRQQMFALVGYRTPTIQRVRLAADGEGHLTAISNEVVEQTSKIKEFAEQTGMPARFMYAASNRLTSHRLAPLDVPVPSWMRAPGECPGMFAPEVAMDELAIACGIDPVELRIRNEPAVDPNTGNPWSSRRLVECLREGAERFGWAPRNPTPRARLENGWLLGTGMASAAYPVNVRTSSKAVIQLRADGVYNVQIGAADIGTGTWTTLAQIAADALGVPMDRIDLQIGDSRLPAASVAGGSSGMSSWGWAVVAAAEEFRRRHGENPAPGSEASAGPTDTSEIDKYAMYAFGAQFAEVRVHADTGEVRVPRMLAVFDAGRIINPLTARSQFIGGMVWGISAALHEQSVLDPQFGHVVNHDFAEYHIPVHADIADIEAYWLDGHDPHTNPMGSKGIGEIGITGSPAAIANAVHHATGIRVRDLPITPDKLL